MEVLVIVGVLQLQSRIEPSGGFMTSFRGPLSRAFVGVLFGSVVLAQTAAGPGKALDKKQDATPGSNSPSMATAKELVQTGIDRPAILVPADSDEVTTKILLRGLDSQPVAGDLETGLL